MKPGPRVSTGMKRDMVTEGAASGPHGVNTEKGSESAFQTQVKCLRDQRRALALQSLSSLGMRIAHKENVHMVPL